MTRALSTYKVLLSIYYLPDLAIENPLFVIEWYKSDYSQCHDRLEIIVGKLAFAIFLTKSAQECGATSDARYETNILMKIAQLLRIVKLMLSN